MKRYKITKEFIDCIKCSEFSIIKLSKILGFEVKNICYKNLTINEKHLQQLTTLLDLNMDFVQVTIDNTKNLGKYAISAPGKSLNRKENLAEFIGIMLGDGNLYKNRINISFDKRNTVYIRYVKNFAKKLFGASFKSWTISGTNSAYLYFYSKNLAENLIKLGLKRGNKIQNKLGIPKWIKENANYLKRCIKGLIDTDGCIYICKRERQKYVKFTNHNKTLLREFKEANKNLGFSFANSNNTNVCLYRIAEVVKFINDIKPNKAYEGP